MAGTQIQYRRGSDTQNDAFTGALGEITVDTTNDTLRVHDGSTAGGFPLVNTSATQTLTNKTLTAPTLSGTATGTANINITGTVTATSFSGDGSQLSGIDATTIQNGTSNVSVISSGGQIDVNVSGTKILSFDSTGVINGQSDGVGNIGNATTGFNTIFAKATSAQYADLAERYATDAEYEPGTVVVIGGAKEATACSTYADHKVLGIISTDPAYKMNQNSEGQDIALTGRVPCKVIGPIERGDLLVTSASEGHAEAWDPQNFVPGSVVGKALEAKTDTGPGVIEVAVGKV